MSKDRSKPDWVRRIAREKISYYLSLARKNSVMEKRYVELALSISQKYKVKMPDDVVICDSCHALLIPGKNCVVRLGSKPDYLISYICTNCGNRMIKGYGKEKRLHRRRKAVA